MATKKVELLLNRTIENLGLVGDVVRVKPGFARNYLLPHGFAEAPTAEKIEKLKDARAAAQAQLAKLRAEREALIGRMEGISIKLVRNKLTRTVRTRDPKGQPTKKAGQGSTTPVERDIDPLRRILPKSLGGT